MLKHIPEWANMNPSHDTTRGLKGVRTTSLTLWFEGRTPLREAAFTFTELLMVLATLTILTLTILPALARSQGPSQRTICSDNLRRLMQATTMYATDYHDYLPSPNWNAPWTVGWLYAPVGNSVPNLTVAPYNANPELAYQGGLLWPYTKDMGLYRCPLDSTNNPTWRGRQNKLSTYVINGAICGYGSIAPRSWRLSQFKPSAFCFWEAPTTNPGDFNDGTSTPAEAASKNHYVTPVATFGGAVEWMTVLDFYRESNLTSPNRAWCNPATSNGR